LWVGVSAIVAFVVWKRRLPPGAALLNTAWLLAAPAVAVLGQCVFRLAYYSDFVPNTAHAKLAASRAVLLSGLEYVGAGIWVLRGALLLALPGILLLGRREWRGLAALLLLPVLATCGYLVVIGGDHFLGWRHLLAPLGGLILLGSLGLSALAHRLHGLA